MQAVRAIQWLLICVALCGSVVHAAPERAAVLETMKRATAFMVEEVSYRGGYVWNYLPDSRRRAIPTTGRT